jgi:Holliday junction DNA helicase RuvB
MKDKDNPVIPDLDFNLLRPQSLNDFIGQNRLKKQLHIFIAAAKKRKEP